jgi:eukaryotic-like serine/threonine-protein kinase
MNVDRWKRMSELFELLSTDVPRAWQPRLLTLCPDAPRLREEVMAMLTHDAAASDRLDAIVNLARNRVVEDEDHDLPTRIGPFELVREIGRGGIGSVWLARRVEGGFEQNVAIKFIKLGMDSREILRLFHQEGRILSLLQHPHIARLIDGGIIATGRPYLIMDFIDGQPLLDWAKSQALTNILRLFQSICGAVQYAHSNLVIHRDLKPANILIDAQGQPKLLDFGIAKILEAGADAGQTQTGVRIFTPTYSSPEQRHGQATSIATDVYSLGAVLEELLPKNPGPDLSAIVQRAMREDPLARYATVEQFSADIENYLDGRPVLARQGNFSYLAVKFLSRNRWPVAVGTAFVLLLAVSLVIALNQSRIIREERDRAELSSRFLSGLFSAADPEHSQGNRLTIGDLLDDGLNRARAIADPMPRYTLMDNIAVAYFGLGLYEKSAAVHYELLKAYEQSGQLNSPRGALTLGYLAEAESARDHHSVATNLAQRAVSIARELSPASPETLARTLQHQCVHLHQASRFDLSVKACAEADLIAAKSALAPKLRSEILVAYGRALQDHNRLADAEQAFENAMPFARAAGTDLNSTSAQVLSGLASLYYRQEKFPQAEKALREAISFKRKLYPNGHLDLARSLNNLANIVSSQQRDPEAVPIFEEAHRYYRQFLGPQSSELASSMSNLAMAKSFLHEYQAAASLMESVVKMQAATVGTGKLPHINSQIKYASILMEDLSQPATARPVLESALAALSKLDSPPPMKTNYAKSMLAFCLNEAGQAASAERLTRESLAGLKGVLPEGHPLFRHVEVVRSGALLRLGRLDEAQELLSTLSQGKEKAKDPGWRTRQIRRYSAELSARRK